MWSPPSVWRPEFSDAGGWTATELNGDGKADVCGRGSAGIHCGLSSGTSFAPTTLWIAEFSNAGGWNATAAYYSTIAFADLNGDRRADVCGRGSSGMHCALSSGSGFAPTSLWVAAFADAGDWSVGPHYYSTIRLTDVTGDGKADVCGRGSPGIYCAASSGTGFSAATVWLGEFSDGGGWAASPAYCSTIRLP